MRAAQNGQERKNILTARPRQANMSLPGAHVCAKLQVLAPIRIVGRALSRSYTARPSYGNTARYAAG